jgi:hypothetical protein
MDWPIAAVILGTLATIAIAIIKLKPTNGKVKPSDIVDWREYEDFRNDVRSRLGTIERDVSCILVKLGGASDS